MTSQLHIDTWLKSVINSIGRAASETIGLVDYSVCTTNVADIFIGASLARDISGLD